MDGAGLNENQGIESIDHILNGNEAELVKNNREEGNNSSNDHGTMQENPQLEMDEEDANSTAPASQDSANASLPESSSANAVKPDFYIERASDLLIVVSLCADKTKRNICDLASSAMNEFLSIAYAGTPLWKPIKGPKFEIMDTIEYLNKHCKYLERSSEIAKLIEVGELRPHVKVEASRTMTYIKINPIDLVHLLMDVNQWRATFFNIVSRAALLGIMTNGVQENLYNGRLQVISSEFHLPTPLVATWECNFARYSKKLSIDTWAIVDVPLHQIFPSPTNVFRRRPSGCLIQEMRNGYCKVTWVENVVADCSKLNIHFRPLVSSGLAFGATRWLASLVRSIECSETLKSENIPTIHGTVIPEEGRAGLLNVAGRMMRTFFGDISGSSSNRWTQIAFAETSQDLGVRVKNITYDQGTATLIFATSFRLPVSPQRLFDFFRGENSRSKWDLYSSKLPTRELAYIIQGNDPRNRVSILQEDNGDGKFYLQESYTDATGSSFVVNALVNRYSLSTLLNGGNPDNVTITPSGFAILPDGVSSGDNDDNCNGGGKSCILTIAYCMMMNGVTAGTSTPFIMTPPERVDQATKFINHIVTGIRDEVLGNP